MEIILNVYHIKMSDTYVDYQDISYIHEMYNRHWKKCFDCDNEVNVNHILKCFNCSELIKFKNDYVCDKHTRRYEHFHCINKIILCECCSGLLNDEDLDTLDRIKSKQTKLLNCRDFKCECRYPDIICALKQY
jgi:hypothetical protein